MNVNINIMKIRQKELYYLKCMFLSLNYYGNPRKEVKFRQKRLCTVRLGKQTGKVN